MAENSDNQSSVSDSSSSSKPSEDSGKLPQQFIVDPNGKAELQYNNQSFLGFMLVDYGPNAEGTHAKLRTITGMADSFPPSSDGYVAYRTFCDLKTYLTANINSLMSSNGAVKDRLRGILWNLHQIAIRCKLDDVILDDDLERIFVSPHDFRVKTIAIKGGAGNEIKWEEELVKVYTKIRQVCVACYKPTPTSQELTLSGPSSIRPHLFWNTFKRMNVLSQLGKMVDKRPTRFWFINSNKGLLLNWRGQMCSDPDIRNVYHQNMASMNNVYTSPNFMYKAQEIDFLLKFVTSTILHFKTMVQPHCHQLNGALALVEHYDSTFPGLMLAIYEGAVEMEKKYEYKFDFDSME